MKDIVHPSDSNRVFIIGNGFDLDLGWNTRFSDYAKSNFWPHNQYVGSILSHLGSRRNLNEWFDLEKEIGAYASSPRTSTSKSNITLNKDCFNKLVEGFKQYLKNEVQIQVKSDSVAAIIFSEILDNQNFSSLYSFNYTDLYLIAQKLNITYPFKYHHMHGSLKEDNIIIGAPEDIDLNPGYEFLYKTFHTNYTSSGLIYDLSEAKEIVFFGHSLGPTDYHYFKSLFQNQCREDLNKADAKRITIFTYDEDARISILKQLRKMNDNKTNLLFHKNDFRVITTKNGVTQEINEFVSHLRKTSAKAYESMMRILF